MRKEKHKIQIGDILYENSVSNEKVIKWLIADIYVSEYAMGNATIFVVESEEYGRQEKFLGDVRFWFDTAEEAQSW